MTKITRRTLLRGSAAGATVAMGIPLLECMGEGRGHAFAQSLNPVGFGVFFWGGGIPHSKLNDKESTAADAYTPAGAAGISPLAPSALLAPLAASSQWLNVVTGLNTASHQVVQRETHFSGQAIALTGDGVAYIDRSDLLYSYSRPSIDRFVAKYPGFYAQPPRRESVHTCAADRFFKSHSGWNCISMDGKDQPVKPILDPSTLYTNLFGGFTPGAGGAQVRADQKSALDAVIADAHRLQQQLGAEDRQRLERHLDGLRSIERQLDAAPPACTLPTAPADAAAGLLPRFELQAEIIVAALRCDITRIFSMMVTGGAHGYKMDKTGTENGPGSTGNHGALHAGNNDAATGNTLLSFKALQHLLGKLSVEESPTGGKLLDNMLIFATSEYATGWHHQHEEFPVILAGKAGGKLKTGQHVRAPGGNICAVQLAMLQGLGLPIAEWGFGGGETSTPLPGLLA